jgi:excinuclease ABC subunit A
VGTITEIHDYLRLLWARIGIPHCPSCGRVIASQSAEQIVDQVHELPGGTRFQVLAPVVRGRKGEFAALFQDLSTKGYARVRVDGQVYPVEEAPKLTKTYKHDIEVVVDRLVQKEDIRRRLSDSIETALQLADGLAMIEVLPGREAVEAARDAGEPEPQAEVHIFSEHLACPHCSLSFDQLAPRNFSFNSPYGACETCSGLGTQLRVDPDLVIGDPSLPVIDGAVLPWATGGGQSTYYAQLLRGVVEHFDVEPETPWEDLPEQVRDAVLNGIDERIHVSYQNRYGRRRNYRARFEGVLAQLKRRHGETDSDHVRSQIEQYMREIPCPACEGARLKPNVLAVTVGDAGIHQVSAMSVEQADRWMQDLTLTDREALIGARVLKEIRARLRFLLDVGLDYLTLDRPAGSLSGGRPSASGWRRRSGRGSSGCCTSWTNRPSGCTNATTNG